jgi:hypothetical protein
MQFHTATCDTCTLTVCPPCTVPQILREAFPALSPWLPRFPLPLWGCLLIGPLYGLPAALARAMFWKKPRISTDRWVPVCCRHFLPFQGDDIQPCKVGHTTLADLCMA